MCEYVFYEPRYFLNMSFDLIYYSLVRLYFFIREYIHWKKIIHTVFYFISWYFLKSLLLGSYVSHQLLAKFQL